MAITPIITGQQTVTSTGPVTPATGLDISGVTGYCTVHIRLQGLSATAGAIPKVTLSMEDTVNAFANSLTVWTQGVQGAIDATNEVQLAIPKHNIPARFGTANAALRINVLGIGAVTGSATLKLDAWLEA